MPTETDLAVLVLIRDAKSGERRVTTSPRHAGFGVHPATAIRLERLGLAVIEKQLSVSLSVRPRSYIRLTDKGRQTIG